MGTVTGGNPIRNLLSQAPLKRLCKQLFASLIVVTGERSIVRVFETHLQGQEELSTVAHSFGPFTAEGSGMLNCNFKRVIAPDLKVRTSHHF